ncbi:MAG: DMT family transporter [Prevotella sp.]|nr:DMT family transporter [Prevotellaceae bacterium]MDY3935573.1 DMT family transporter [Prevotella sp.]
MNHRRIIIAHLSMLGAVVAWGLMSPIGKDAMTHGISGISMVGFRVFGAAILFWITSLFTAHEHVPVKDIFLFGAASIFGVTYNQCLFILGLNYTSPVNASVITTSMPIFAMIWAFFILKEPITWQKACGVAVGCVGAVILILTSLHATNSKVGDFRGDLMVLGAQLSFSLYLSLFNGLIKRYSVVTINKWMFFWATIYVLPISLPDMLDIDFPAVRLSTWSEVGFVVFFGTFVSYILMMIGQHTLRPTVVSVYNYVQPIVAVTVSLLAGIGVFTTYQATAILLVFIGVWMVVKSRSKRDMEAKENVCQREIK